jgi:hypothetical protein
MKEKTDEIKKLKDVNGYGMGNNETLIVYMERDNLSTRNRISEILIDSRYEIKVIGEIKSLIVKWKHL